ncbi:hypothetical protein DL93DRAFT_2100162 [Clavulina sp. PMI_390]|nr:hypothetical protein DL93DRAFT_2100162 [Clavulina sp. PMI_390]
MASAAMSGAEEATNIANEYIYSIDNLSNEVQFLLGEIRYKDEQVADIESRVLKKSNELFSRKQNGPLTPKDVVSIEKMRESLERVVKLNEEKVVLAKNLQRISSRAVNKLDYDLQRIRTATGDTTLGADIVGMAGSIGSLSAGGSVLGLPGAGSTFGAGASGANAYGAAGSSTNAVAAGSSVGRSNLHTSYNAAQAQAVASASLAPAVSAAAATPTIATPTVPIYTPQLPVQVPEAQPASLAQGNKRRRITNQNGPTAIATNLGASSSTASLSALPAAASTPTAVRRPNVSGPPAASSPASTPAPPQRKRAAAPVVVAPSDEMEAEDGEGEEDAVQEEEDNNPYCYCHQPSHGEMIACDGDNCPYEWVRFYFQVYFPRSHNSDASSLVQFHLACLGMKHPPKGSKWFCSDCTPNAELEVAPPEKTPRKRK